VQRAIRQTNVLEKYAATTACDDVLEMKSAQALDILSYIKKASKEAGLQQILEQIPEGTRKGLAYGAGAMVPITAGGAYIAHRRNVEAKDTATHLRNQALLAALGIGGLGAVLVGLHRSLSPTKEASIASHTIDTEDLLLEKLATVGFLDVILEAQEKNSADTTLRQDAMECRRLNAEYGLDLLQQLLT